MSDYEFWNELDHIFEAVLAYQKKNIEFNKAFISPWVRLGRVFPRDDSTQQSLQALLHAAELDPEHEQNWTDLGDAFYKMGNLEEAVEAYGKAIEMNPSAAWPKSNLALALATQGNYQEAIPLYKESLERFLENRDKAVTWNRLGNAYRKLGDFENAVGAFLRADELDTKTSNHRDPMFESLEPEGVEELFRGISDPEADHVAQNPQLASDELAARQAPDDLQSSPMKFQFAFEDELDFTAMASDPGKSLFPEESMEPAPGNGANSEPDPASLGTSLEEFLSQHSGPNSNELEEAPLDDPGYSYSGGPANHEAETQINLDKDDRSSTEQSPINFLEQGEGKESAIGKQSRIEIAHEERLQGFIEPPGIIGGERTEQSPESRFAPQTRESEDARIQFDTQNANVWNEMGNIYFSSGAYDDAILAYRQAIELDSQFAWAYSNLALTFVQKERFEEAILLYDRSIALFKNAKDKAVTWNRLGNLYRRQQDYDNAILAYQTADELDPDNIALSLRSRFSLLGSLMEEQPAYSS